MTQIPPIPPGNQPTEPPHPRRAHADSAHEFAPKLIAGAVGNGAAAVERELAKS